MIDSTTGTLNAARASPLAAGCGDGDRLREVRRSPAKRISAEPGPKPVPERRATHGGPDPAAASHDSPAEAPLPPPRVPRVARFLRPRLGTMAAPSFETSRLLPGCERERLRARSPGGTSVGQCPLALLALEMLSASLAC